MSLYRLKKQSTDILINCFFYILTISRVLKKRTAVAMTPITIPTTTTIVPFKTKGASNPEQYLPPSPPRSDKDDDEVEECIPLPPPSINPTKVLDIDLNTPDAHVPRDPRLIRLTGVHPFNVEAPLSALFDSGMYPCLILQPLRFHFHAMSPSVSVPWAFPFSTLSNT